MRVGLRWLIVGVLYIVLVFLLVVKGRVFGSLYRFGKAIKTMPADERQKLVERFRKVRGKEVEGFLWGINNRNVYLVNLRNLRKFGLTNKSALFYFDICKYRNEQLQEGVTVERTGPFGVGEYWRRAEAGDYVDLELYEENGEVYVDKLWGYSGYFYLNGKVPKEELCGN